MLRAVGTLRPSDFASPQQDPFDDVVDRLARRYWSQRAKDAPSDRMRRTWAFLVRRGFPPGLVHDRLRTLWPRWHEALEELAGAED
jgi:hypothetical protein